MPLFHQLSLTEALEKNKEQAAFAACSLFLINGGSEEQPKLIDTTSSFNFRLQLAGNGITISL